MRHPLRSLVVVLACSGPWPAMAQMEEVVVTGARISGDDYLRMPAIVLERRADFLVQRVRPEKYRYDIIARITEDAKRLQNAVASQCKVEISGLSNRVSWQRSDISELTLYIPYQVQLSGCQ